MAVQLNNLSEALATSWPGKAPAAALLSFCVMSMGSQAGPVFDLTDIDRIESYKQLPAGAVGAAFATAEGFGWLRLLRATSNDLSFELGLLPVAQRPE